MAEKIVNRIEELPLVGFYDVDPHQPDEQAPIRMWEIVHALEAASSALDEMDAHCDPKQVSAQCTVVRILVRLLMARESGEGVKRVRRPQSKQRPLTGKAEVVLG